MALVLTSATKLQCNCPSVHSKISIYNFGHIKTPPTAMQLPICSFEISIYNFGHIKTPEIPDQICCTQISPAFCGAFYWEVYLKWLMILRGHFYHFSVTLCSWIRRPIVEKIIIKTCGHLDNCFSLWFTKGLFDHLRIQENLYLLILLVMGELIKWGMHVTLFMN